MDKSRSVADETYLLAERAAIIEFCGNETRAEAERLAKEQARTPGLNWEEFYRLAWQAKLASQKENRG